MNEREVVVGMSIPLDSDGFMRRECPTCEREFKWLHSAEEDEDTELVVDGGYFCPYCGVQTPVSDWFTQAQIELAQNVVEREVVEPMIREFADVSTGTRPQNIEPLTESDDMTRVNFTCHPSEPLKILNDWEKPAYCLICGLSAS